MKIYQFILILVLVYLAGVFTLLDLEKFPIKTIYKRIEVCPKLGFTQCLELGGIPISSDNPYTTELLSCEFIK